MLPEFDFLIPKSLPDALRLLNETQAEVVPVAGGTNVVVDLRGRRHTPRYVLNIDCLPELKTIHLENGRVTVGACVTIADLLKSPEVRRSATELTQAAAVFANPLVRNRATLGGNLVDASPAADSAPPLLTLDAEVELTGLAGSRWLPLEDFFVHVRKTRLQPGELLTAVRWTDSSAAHEAAAYYKLGLRKADAISVVSVAVRVALDEQGRCQKARIALGSVAPRPIRAHQAEEALLGRPIDADACANAGRLAAEAAAPIADIRASADYRRRMVAVFTRRLLEQAAGQLKQAE